MLARMSIVEGFKVRFAEGCPEVLPRKVLKLGSGVLVEPGACCSWGVEEPVVGREHVQSLSPMMKFVIKERGCSR